MHDPRCPTCGVTMEETHVTAAGSGRPRVETDREGGILDRLGIGKYTPINSYVCPECGLVQLYSEEIADS